jgi:hypothetical protein
MGFRRVGEVEMTGRQEREDARIYNPWMVSGAASLRG